MIVYHFPVSSLENKTALSSSTRAKTCSSLKKGAIFTGRHTDSEFVLLRNEKNFILQFVVFQGQSRGGDVVVDGEEGRILLRVVNLI